jgi:hypothetical protein
VAFDVLVLAAHKDYPKLPFVLDAIGRNVDGFDRVYLCTPEPFDASHMPIEVCSLIDMDVLKAEPRRWRHRPNWVYQQFIKLFQEATPNDMYLCVDADTIINKPLPLFAGTTPIWWCGNDQHHQPYFAFSEAMLGMGRVYPRSFIADIFFFSRDMVWRMLAENGYTVASFIEKSYETITSQCYPSEAEMYMSFVWQRYPEAYEIRQLSTRLFATRSSDPMVTGWSQADLEDKVEEMRDSEFQTFSLHSWCDTSHDSWSEGVGSSDEDAPPTPTVAKSREST